MKNKISLSLYSGIVNGIVIGLMFSILFSYINASENYLPAPPKFINYFSNSTTAMLVSVVLWAIIGLVFSCGSLIFRLTDWSITKMTIVHFIVCYTGFLPIAIICGWFPFSLISIFNFTVIYILIYIVMWLIFMNIAKKEINKMNAKLKNKYN